MNARVLNIEKKFRANPILLASLQDFTYQEGDIIDPQVIFDQPAISLYCLDDPGRQAIFVETPPEVDLSQAPFYYQAQFEHAQRLIALPYEALHHLAQNRRPQDEALILIYSVGRCGSTLLSRVFNLPENVLSLSEPDVFTQIVTLRERDGRRDEELAGLLADCVAVLCKPSSQKTPTFWALKFRSFGIEIADLLHRTYPKAKLIFLYRHAESWAQSITRTFQSDDPASAKMMQRFFEALDRFIPLLPVYMARTPGGLSAIELLSLLWLSVMQRYMALREQGIQMVATRYEDLRAAPQLLYRRLFDYCGLPMPDPVELERVLASDSQAGSILARSRVRQVETVLDEAQLAQLRAFLQAEPVINTPDFVAPGTLSIKELSS
jgi:hypothetical protein